MYSSLALAGKSDGNGEGSLLEAWEVAQLDLRAELAVLSACDTAGGKVRRGEGLIGMAWAFLAAGAQTVVVSQWAIDSQVSATLMTSFHRKLRSTSRGEKEDSATALRRVVLTTMRSPGTEHPFFWAGFSVFGRGW
jgi:CHAT domain-containing protein